MAGSKDDGGADKPRVPGWYPDPWSATGTGERYFDGKSWGTTERPLARHTSTPSESETRSRNASGRFRRVVAPMMIIVLVAVGVVYLRSHGSTGAKVAASPSTTRSTTTTDDGRHRSGCGRYCKYTLAGDWPNLHQGDCVNVRTDTDTKTFSFSRVSCRTRHDAELYFVRRPDPVNTLSPGPSSIADLISRVCGVDELKNYAPHFAATHPDAVSRAGTYGDERERVCDVGPDVPTQPIR